MNRPKGRGRNRHEDDHWERTWERLRREGRVDIVNPEAVKPPYFPSSCDGLARAARGEPSAIISVKRTSLGMRQQRGDGKGLLEGGIRRAE